MRISSPLRARGLFVSMFSAVFLVLALCTQALSLPVFPGAEGFGTSTPAGRGGQVYKVTNLNVSGAGSLKACVDAVGPRVCVFEVSGTIDISSLGAWGLRVKNPYITIAGQTAPSPGIMLRGATFIIETHDVLVQHIRIRPGDAPGSGCAVGPDNCDAMAIIDLYDEKDVYNVVIDHCSLSWGIDEVFSTWYTGVRDITLRDSIISEALHESIHPKGPHGFGVIVGTSSTNVSVLGNLLAHNSQRNALLNPGTKSVVANNLIYNAGLLSTHVDSRIGLKASIAGNVYIKGVDTSSLKPIYIFNADSTASVYVSDNAAVGATSNPWSVVTIVPSDVISHASTPPVWAPGMILSPSGEVKNKVLANAGARPADRDPVDTRIVNGVKNGTGRIINCVAPNGSARCSKNAGGWPSLAYTYRALTLPSNPSGDSDGDGYTNLEEWLHSYAAAVEGTQTALKVPGAPVMLQVQ